MPLQPAPLDAVTISVEVVDGSAAKVDQRPSAGSPFFDMIGLALDEAGARIANNGARVTGPTIADLDLSERLRGQVESALKAERPSLRVLAEHDHSSPRLAIRMRHGFYPHSRILFAPFAEFAFVLTAADGMALGRGLVTVVGNRNVDGAWRSRPEWWSEQGRYRRLVLIAISAAASAFARELVAAPPAMDKLGWEEVSLYLRTVAPMESYSEPCAVQDETTPVWLRFHRTGQGIFVAALCDGSLRLGEVLEPPYLRWLQPLRK